MREGDLRLPATPLAELGPLQFEPSWLAGLTDSDKAGRWWRQQRTMPVVGDLVEVAGVRLQQVSFCAWSAEDQVLLHLNGFTDAHRTDIRPALLQPVAGSALRVLSYLLPVSGRYSYRLLRRRYLPHDLGRERSDWLGVHLDGRADPLNPVLLPGGGQRPDSSVWVGCEAPAFPPIVAEPQWWHDDLPDGRRVAWHHEPGAEHTLVLFDGERWEHHDPRVLPGLGRVNLILIPAGQSEQRSADLTDIGRAAELVGAALSVLARRRPESDQALRAERVIVAGQSFGGLAAAGVAVWRPDLVGAAIVQSGSFWYRKGVPWGFAEPGELTESLARSPGALTRLALQVGSEEADLRQQARWFTEAARAAGHRVDYREYRGGHDYAWWFPALAEGLDVLLG
ncbi:enterochelin esterase domain-containing protein [Micropruina sp.]|uniref:enterochelin esterase domain-containing protein n=1 Tax=Micropruina sp. TaxID=2737536 RepID=UPI0039E3DB6B